MDIKQMTLREKIGQLFTFPAFASEVDEATAKLIKEYKIGGVFLGTGVLQKPEQVHKLTSELQHLSITEGSGETLLVSADFVGGVGCKINNGSIHFPKNRAIGASKNEALAYESGKFTALESLAVGVNYNYSPVVDINNNPLNPVIGTHSFGENRDEVVRLANAVIRGYQDHGLIATAKHFPGHGDTNVDSHYDLPVLPFDKERLHSFELVPFKKAIEAGVGSIMVGHMAVPSLDPTLTPASLSYPITTELLREELGFEGIIITDGLSMKGVTNKYGMEEAGVLALLAGSDILLATTDGYDQSVRMFEAIYEAVQQGRISEARIDQSVNRILKAKAQYKLNAADYNATFKAENLNTCEGFNVALTLAKEALTVKGDVQQGLLNKLLVEQGKLTIVYDTRCEAFIEQLNELDGIHTIQYTELDEGTEQATQLTGTNTVIFVSAGHKPIGQAKAKQIEASISTFEHKLWIHFGSQYDIEHVNLPCIVLYDMAKALQIATALYITNK